MAKPDLSSHVSTVRPTAAWPRNAFLLALAATLVLGFGRAPASATENVDEKQRLRIVFEISSPTDVAYDLFLTNVEGVQRNFANLADIAVIASADGVRLLKSAENPFDQRLSRLADRGIDFMVCSRSLEQHGLAPSSLLGFTRTIRSGTEEIQRLEAHGWASVRDGETYVSDF